MNYFDVFGIVISMVLLLFLTYKGLNIVYVAPICALLVIVSNGLPFSSITDTYLSAIGDWMSIGFFYAILGSILGKIYESSGAAENIGYSLMRLFTAGREIKTTHRSFYGVLAIYIMQILVTGSGISGTVVMIISFPIAVGIAKDCDIPRRLIPVIISSGAISAIMAAPGVPTIGNIIASSILDTKATAGLLGGIIAFIVVAVPSLIYTYHLIKRAHDNGEKYDYNIDEKHHNFNNGYPNIFIAIIPLALVFIMYAIIGWSIGISLSLSTVIALILFAPYLNKDSNQIKNVLQNGVQTGTYVFFLLSSTLGFASVIQSTSVFIDLTNYVQALVNTNGSPFIVATVVVFWTLVTASPPAALQLGLPAFLPSIQLNTINANAVHRISVFATTTFETMPYSGAVIAAIQMSNTTHKEAYRPLFVCTVFLPLIATYILALLYTIFPFLAQV